MDNQEPWRARFKARFQQLKASEGLTQDKLGQRVGVSQGTIGHWLTGRRTPKDQAEMNSLAYALGLHPAFLTHGINPNQKSDISYISGASAQQTVPVKSFAQIISNERGTTTMQFFGEITENSVFYLVESDLMEGNRGAYIPRGSVLRIESGEMPAPGDVALYNIKQSPALGYYSVIAGKPYLRPSNPQYQSVDASEGELIGTVHQVLTTLKQL